MKKNLYFRQVLRRRNLIGEAITNFFLRLASYPRLLLEVFIRKNFGDRYFSLASVITLFVVLTLLPAAYDAYTYEGYLYRFSLARTIFDHKSWYLFLGLFLGFSVIRYREIKANPSVFDFGRYSLSSGDINQLFFDLRIFGKKPSPRAIETLYEPAVFFILGWVTGVLDPLLGTLLLWSSICYSMSYLGAYKVGDNFIKDKIDEMICNQELENAFIGDEDNNKHGVRFRAAKPTSRQMRSDLADSFVVEGVEAFEVAEAM